MFEFKEKEVEALARLADKERARREQEAQHLRRELEELVKTQPNDFAD